MTKKKKPAARKTRVKRVRIPGQHPKDCLCPFHSELRREAWRAGREPSEAPIESGWSDNFKGALLVIAGLAALAATALWLLS